MRSNRFARYLCLALLVAGATATTAEAQRRGGTHVRIGVGIGRPVVFAGGYYRPYYAGYRLRGHQFTDANGRFSLETIVPGLYPGRTRHIHVKVQRPNGAILTTQLYFPGEARNASDGIYSAELLMNVVDGANGKDATFNFVVR